jgi:predicted AAA+ superfamily ATPase
VGKTTLARQIAGNHKGPVTYFDLEDPDDLARLRDPKLALGSPDGLVIIDEVQRRPDLFPVLRVLVDRTDFQTKFLILGSAAPDLLRQTSETLAGRIAYHQLGGFDLGEVGIRERDRLWLRGGFPRAFLAPDESASCDWRRDFVQTFLERDLPQLGFRIPGETLHRFWRMLAHYHGQIWNGAELARAFGVASSTVRRYLDVLDGALVIWQLPPWYENISKRQVRSPKVYIADTGLLHVLLGLETREGLLGHPKVGASWEGHVLRELIVHLGARREECFFWATQTGAELDLLIVRGQRRIGIEVKRTTAPKSTKSQHAARETLGLEEILVVHAGEHSFPLSDGIRALAFERFHEELPPLQAP